MSIRLAENIRKFRKERSMTQEQLAEAMGVTIGAVSKWELGSSVPDIDYIVELAQFFETSVDVLLGYEWKKGGMGEAAEEIKQLRRDREFRKGIRAAEKALQKYPNCFDVVYQSAMLYYLMLDAKSSQRALELFQRACELIDQNTDPDIGLVTIQNDMAGCYCGMGRDEEAIKLLKKNNFDGMNNGRIGTILAYKLHRGDEALRYLSIALGDSMSKLYSICIGFANAYADRKEYAKALELLQWLYETEQGIREPDIINYMDKGNAVVLAVCAEFAVLMSDRAGAYSYLKRAKETAERFDAAPDYSARGIKYYHGPDTARAYDDIGETAMDGIRGFIYQNEDIPELKELWEQLMGEG